MLFILTLLGHDGHLIEEPFVGKHRKDVQSYITENQKTLVSIKQIKLSRFQKIDSKVILDFFHYLAILLEAGQTFLGALTDIYKSFKVRQGYQKCAPLVFFLMDHIKRGGDFAVGLRAFPTVFTETTVNIVERGLTSGNLALTFDKAYHFLKRQDETQKSFKKALAYPMILCVTFIIMFIGMSELLLPNVVTYLNDLGVDDLPLASQSLLSVKAFWEDFGIGFSSIIGILTVLIMLAWRVPTLKQKLTPYMIKLPLFGYVYQTFYMLIWLETVGELYGLDHNLKDSLEKGTKSLKNPYFSALLMRMTEHVVQGQSLSEAMAHLNHDRTSHAHPVTTSGKGHFFTPFTLSLCQLGLQSGKLSHFLLKAYTMEKHFLTERLDRLLKIIEPFFIILMGLLLLWIVMGVVLPLYQHLDLAFAQKYEILYKERPILC